MKHQTVGGLEPSGNVLVQTNCLDIKMALKTSCKDVATRVGVGRFALHIFCLGFGAPLPPQRMPLLLSLQTRVSALHFRCWYSSSLYLHSNFSDGLQNAGA